LQDVDEVIHRAGHVVALGDGAGAAAAEDDDLDAGLFRALEGGFGVFQEAGLIDGEADALEVGGEETAGCLDGLERCAGLGKVRLEQGVILLRDEKILHVDLDEIAGGGGESRGLRRRAANANFEFRGDVLSGRIHFLWR
jgi:hypothetical protein